MLLNFFDISFIIFVKMTDANYKKYHFGDYSSTYLFVLMFILLRAWDLATCAVLEPTFFRSVLRRYLFDEDTFI